MRASALCIEVYRFEKVIRVCAGAFSAGIKNLETG